MGDDINYQRLDDSEEPSGQIVYSLVAKGQIILTESSISTGNFPTITRVVLSKLDINVDNEDKEEGKQQRKTYKYDS